MGFHRLLENYHNEESVSTSAGSGMAKITSMRALEESA